MQKYSLEFLLSVYNLSARKLASSLSEFSEGLEIAPLRDEKNNRETVKIRLVTDDPTVIFDICSQFGRIKSVKVQDV